MFLFFIYISLFFNFFIFLFLKIFSGENSDAEGGEEDVTKQLAVRSVGQYEDEGGWGFDRKSDFLTTSHVIRLFGAGTQV